jgi:hypothetical protein
MGDNHIPLQYYLTTGGVEPGTVFALYFGQHFRQVLAVQFVNLVVQESTGVSERHGHTSHASGGFGQHVAGGFCY